MLGPVVRLEYPHRRLSHITWIIRIPTPKSKKSAFETSLLSLVIRSLTLLLHFTQQNTSKMAARKFFVGYATSFHAHIPRLPP